MGKTENLLKLTSIIDAAVQFNNNCSAMDLVDELREGLLARHVDKCKCTFLAID